MKWSALELVLLGCVAGAALLGVVLLLGWWAVLSLGVAFLVVAAFMYGVGHGGR